MSAVSMKLPPAFTKASMTANDAASSAVQPNCIEPKQRFETVTPVRPSCVDFMAVSLPRDAATHERTALSGAPATRYAGERDDGARCGPPVAAHRCVHGDVLRRALRG